MRIEMKRLCRRIKKIWTYIKKKRGRRPKEVVKKERVASSYATFVKTHYDSVRSLATKERFKALSELWKKEKEKTKVVK